MTEDAMVGWHHQLNGFEFEQTPGDSEGRYLHQVVMKERATFIGLAKKIHLGFPKELPGQPSISGHQAKC